MRRFYLLICLAMLAALPARAQGAAGVIFAAESYDSASGQLKYCYIPGGTTCVPGAPDTLYLTAGSTLTFVHPGGTHVPAEHHSVTSFALGSNGKPLFDSGLIGIGEAKDVKGVSSLAAGRYKFFCIKHQYEQGYLNIVNIV